MTTEIPENFIRAHRRKLDLAQRELGTLIGYGCGYAVGTHERSEAVPPFLIALAYEAIFDVPVSEIFAGFRSAVRASVAGNIRDLNAEIEMRCTGNDQLLSEKVQWLTRLQQRLAD